MSLNWWWGDKITPWWHSCRTSKHQHLLWAKAVFCCDSRTSPHVTCVHDWQRGAFQSMTRLVIYLTLILLRYLQEDLKGWQCCCSQDAILFIVQQWLILVLHGRMRYWNPVRVSMWAPMVKHGNFVMDATWWGTCQMKIAHEGFAVNIRCRWIAYKSLCTHKRLAYE